MTIKEIRYKIALLLVGLIPLGYFRRKLRNKVNIKIVNKIIAPNINKKYVLPYIEGRAKKWHLAQKKDIKETKIIWQFWYQGMGKAPEIVKNCLNSVQRHMSKEYKIVVITKENMDNYIKFPDFVYRKIKNGSCKLANFSDLLRTALLSQYGGIWIDATVFLSDPLPKDIIQQDFFAFQRSKVVPKNYKRWLNYNARYFSWKKNHKINLLSSFMVAKKNSVVVTALKDMLLNYWEKEDKAIIYYFFQIIFDYLIKVQPYSEENQYYLDDIFPHLLHIEALKSFDTKLWEDIKSKISIHKLTYFEKIPQNSMLNIIFINEKKEFESKDFEKR